MARRKKKKKRVKVIVAVVLIAAAGYGGWSVFMRGGRGDTPAPPISMKKGAIVDRLTETGRVEYARVVEVKSAISGRVITLTTDDGQHVKENEVMAIIEPDPDQALRLSEAAVSVKRCKIIWKQKKLEFERLSNLYEKELISKEQWEDAKDELDLAKHNYDLAELQQRILQEEAKSVTSPAEGEEPDSGDNEEVTPVAPPVGEGNPDSGEEDSEIQLQDFKVQAPLAGVVIERNVEEGDMVIRGTSSFTQGTTLFRIGDPRKVIVSSMINEIDEAKLSVGMPVKIVPNADPQRPYRGEIEKIAPLGVPVNNIVYFRVEILVLEPDSFLKQGMTCDVDIVLGEKEEIYYLPVESVLKVYKKDKEGKETKQIDKYMVYKKAGDEYEKVEVKVGLKSETRMEILSGLSPEDKVHPDAEKMAKKSKKKEEQAERSQQRTRGRPLGRHG
jgi:HlyD family secretion protein